MKVGRCSKCGKVKEIVFHNGELPAQLVLMCKCKDRF